MKYKCILADPPWSFRDKGSRIAPDAKHYQTADLAEIVSHAEIISHVANKNCHLWLCAPNAFVLDGSASMVARLWGFAPKQLLTWIKPGIGMGHWMRNSTEQVLFCVRGRLAPLTKNTRTDMSAASKRHSEKPDELYRHIESVSPGPRIDMYARRAIEGWDRWGNEAPDGEGKISQEKCFRHMLP